MMKIQTVVLKGASLDTSAVEEARKRAPWACRWLRVTLASEPRVEMACFESTADWPVSSLVARCENCGWHSYAPGDAADGHACCPDCGATLI